MSSPELVEKNARHYPLSRIPLDETSRITAPSKRQELWLAFYFMELSLETTFSQQTLETKPCGIWELKGQQQKLISVNTVARELGLRSGIKVSEAWLQVPELNVSRRNLVNEQKRLDMLGAIALRFSSKVSLSDTNTLLLEIAGSLRLFNGLEKLLHNIEEEVFNITKYFSYSVMPTPVASLLCAKSSTRAICTEKRLIYSHISQIPVGCFEQNSKILQTLDRMGVTTMNELLRLPRQGLSKRFGSLFVKKINCLVGDSPDPQKLLKPRLYFEQHQELEESTTNTNQIIHINQTLLQQLESFLITTNSIARYFMWKLYCGTHIEEIVIRPGTICRQADDLSILFNLRLESITLSSPVTSISLQALEFEVYKPPHYSLFPDFGTTLNDSTQALVDRLRMRLGNNSVFGLRPVEDYRPEQSWEICEPGAKFSDYSFYDKKYPLWILKKPIPLKYSSPYLYFNGPLRLHTPTEHIKFGWWDNDAINRKYRKAIAENGQRLWIYHDQYKDRWFLHGFFN